jgi:acyl carrier protein phosphodiesterase
MNYLGHLYLSGNEEKVVVGNFIGDYVKGKNVYRFPDKIRDGILLHRQIDTFTDNHPKVSEAKKLFREDYRLYSGIIVDFLYDHFLASNWNGYSDLTLRSFSKHIHAILLSHFKFLPSRVQGFLPFLIQNKRLESYASVDGIIQSIRIMSKYTSLPEKTDTVNQILLEHYDYLANNFWHFMNDMIEFVTVSHQIKLQKSKFNEGI